MILQRPLPSNFLQILEQKNSDLIKLYLELRNTVLETYPDANELLYHTHALTSVFTVSEKMSDGFCLIPIYNEHLNFGFQRGTLLEDSIGLLRGTGKLMRHIPLKFMEDITKVGVMELLENAYNFAINDAGSNSDLKGVTISKLK